MFRLEHKVAAITGAGSGIGKAIAELFSDQGAIVHVLELEREAGEAVTSALRERGATAFLHACDVTQYDQVNTAFERIKEESGCLDILVNNAGVGHIGTVEQTEVDDFDRLYQINVKGVFHCLKAAIPLMIKSGGGSIVNLASTASLVGIPDRFVYSMSKGAVLTMNLSVATDYVDKGIRSNCICPARVHTPFVDSYLAKNYPGREQEMFDTLAKTQPIGRMGKPDEIASLALYLCSDEAAFVTGGAYTIDGGFVTLK